MNINSKCKAVMLANGATSVPITCPLHGMIKCPEVERATPAAASAGAAGTIDTPEFRTLLTELDVAEEAAASYGEPHHEKAATDAYAAFVAHIDQDKAAAIASLQAALDATIKLTGEVIEDRNAEIERLRAGQARATEPGMLTARPNGSENGYDIDNAEGFTIAGNVGKDNARRIVACWNACDGSEIEDLERLGADFIKPLIDLIDERDRLASEVSELRAATAPASAAPAGKFKIGDTVRKTKGSQWSGEIVGTYSTSLTPEGYAVESSTERGSVQIYPAGALELVAAKQAGKES